MKTILAMLLLVPCIAFANSQTTVTTVTTVAQDNNYEWKLKLQCDGVVDPDTKFIIKSRTFAPNKIIRVQEDSGKKRKCEVIKIEVASLNA